MATAPRTLVGCTVSIAADTPATEDETGYDGISPAPTEIGGVLSVPETGNSSEAGSVALLKEGLTQHYNGVLIVEPFVIPYKYDRSDAGQVIVRAGENGTTEHTLKITDPDGDEYWIQGVIGPIMQRERTPNGYKGESFEFRPITMFTKVDGAS